ncbi:Stp1/IreP family PP2C-type Ser/Thr phosphatase [Acidobacteriota bacterium]
MPFEVFGNTDIGKKRTINEDNFVIFELSEKPEPMFLLAVADGLGGHAGGEIASKIAIDSLRKNLVASIQKAHNPSTHFNTVMENAFKNINKEIFQKAAKEKLLTGMGTTLVASLIKPYSATILNVGDSRAYLLRGNSINQITLDHSWKAENLRNNQLDKDEIFKSPLKNLLTRSLGFENKVKADTFQLELFEEDILLLCTDGLYSLLTEKDILKILKKYESQEKICQKLIDLANKRGGHDNITVIIAKFLKKAH